MNSNSDLKAQSGLVAITSWAIHLPGVDLSDLIGLTDYEPACFAESAHELLGRKGLFGKDSATRLALCAVHRALHRAPRAPRPEGAPDVRTGVIVSSNLGNIATVEKVMGILRDGNVRDISPMDAPNASSNVIASSIAIWFRFGGPNLMVCSGGTSGLDAVYLACLLLRTGRADRVAVVGVEPDDAIAAKLYGEQRLRLGTNVNLLAGAACVVLETWSEGTAEGPVLGRSLVFHGPNQVDPADSFTSVIGPVDWAPPRARVIDLSQLVGDLFGGQGVLQLAAAAAMLEKPVDQPLEEWAVICGNSLEGWRWLSVGPHYTQLSRRSESDLAVKT